MAGRLKDKIGFITGAGSGIGRGIAQRFAAEGAHVWVLDRDENGGRETVKMIQAEGGSADFKVFDVTDTAAVNDFFKKQDRIDILVNNAGVSSIGTVEETTPEEMDRVYQVNVKGVYHCLQAVIPTMKKQGQGVILNLASIASKIGVKDRFAYSMTKGAVYTMTLSVARDYVDQGIRCNCVCPARVHTPFVDAYLDKHYPENRDEMFETLSQYQPMGRMGKPGDVAALVTFLCSDDAAFITGSAYDIDGGTTLLR